MEVALVAALNKVKITRTEWWRPGGCPIRRTATSRQAMYAAGWEDHSKWTVVADACMLGSACSGQVHWNCWGHGVAVPVWQSLGNLASLLQSSVLCLSGDRLAEKPVAD